jgi:hypothetical protein
MLSQIELVSQEIKRVNEQYTLNKKSIYELKIKKSVILERIKYFKQQIRREKINCGKIDIKINLMGDK